MSARPELAHLRIPPHSVESEQAVLGGLLLDATALAKLTLSDGDFYRRDHQLIFRAICELEQKSQACDVVTVGEWFDSRGLSGEVDGGAYLMHLAANTPSAANIRAYAGIVRDKAILREAIDIGTQLIGACFGGSESAAATDEAIRALMSLSKSEQPCEFTLKQAVRLAWADVEEAASSEGKLRGVTTGIGRMDKRMGGWHRGDLVFIGARPSMGKTALMVNMALAAAKADAVVGVISGEQSALQIGQRSLAAAGNVHAERMRNGDIDDEAWAFLNSAVVGLAGYNLRIYDRSAPTLDEIGRLARKWVHEHGLRVLFVDYLQRIRHPKAQNRIDEVSEVARGLKTLARDLDITVVCLAQVKAEVDKRDDKRPGLGDIANSDEATREADLIAFLYRDEVYNDNAASQGLAELNVEKYRHGPTGQFKLAFDAGTMRFRDLSHDDWN